jgi:integrase
VEKVLIVPLKRTASSSSNTPNSIGLRPGVVLAFCEQPGKEIPREHTDAIRQALVELAPKDPLRYEADLFFACLFDVALGTGLRLGELRALRWRDVDRDRRVIRIERSYSRWAALQPASRRQPSQAIPYRREAAE